MNRLQAVLVFVLWHGWMSGCCWSGLFYFKIMDSARGADIALFTTSMITLITVIAYRESAKFYAARCLL